MKLLVRLLVLLAAPNIAWALGLGDPVGQVVIGQPLAVRIPLLGADSGAIRTECVRVLTVENEPLDRSLASALIKMDGSSLLLLSREPVSHPILSFRLSLGCGLNLERSYQLLSQRPQTMVDPIPAPSNVIAPPSVGTVMPKQQAQSSGAWLAIKSPTTLRLISRSRYPGDSSARVAFIRRVAAANPEVFASIDAAFDQMISPGMDLRIPENVPRQVSSKPATAAKSTPVKLPAADVGGKGKGRLIIGATEFPVRSAEELEADIDRLVGIMNEQIQIQMSMAERLNKLETEVAQAKQAATSQKETNDRLGSEIKELRDEQRRNSYIQLVLAILVGGFGVASFLFWREQLRSKERMNTEILAASIPTFSKTPPSPKQQPLVSIFDDLLPPK